MSKASEKALGELHGLLAQLIINDLNTVFTDSEGNPLPRAPALISQARQFLKDNHIEVGAGAKPGALHGLAGLPVFGEDENVVPIRKEK